MASATVVCAGDVMLDSFVHGEVSRISPEAPIPVLRIKRCQSMLGGAGNAVRNLAALGCAVRFFSVTGDDTEAGNIRNLFEELPGNCAVLEREPGRQTSGENPVPRARATTASDRQRDGGTGERGNTRETARGVLRSASPACSIVLLSDYAKGVLNGDYAQEYIAAARAAGKPVVVDPKGRDFTRYRGATLIKPNLHELGEATGMAVSGDAAQEAASRRLLAIREQITFC